MSSMYGNRGATGNSMGISTGGNNIPKGYELGQIQQFTPEQQKLFSSLLPHVGQDSYLSKLAGGDEQLFSQIEGPALKQFNGLQGQIASRFSGMGMGSRRSSGFKNTMNEASSDFVQQLQSKRNDLRSQAIRDLMGLSSQLLGQRPQEQFLAPEKMPFWQQFISSLAGGFGSGVGNKVGGLKFFGGGQNGSDSR